MKANEIGCANSSIQAFKHSSIQAFKHSRYKFTKRILPLLVGVMMLISACTDNKLSLDTESSSPEQTLSPVDGKPITTVGASEVQGAHAEVLLNLQRELALRGEKAIKQLFQENQHSLASENPDTPYLPLHQLPTEYAETGTKSLGLEDYSAQLRIVHEDGTQVNYTMSIYPWPNFSSDWNKTGSQASLAANSSNSTWLALDPDRFYLEESVNKGTTSPGTKVKDLWVLDFFDWVWKFEPVRLEAKGHYGGGSDEVIPIGSLKNVNVNNVKKHIANSTDFKVASKDYSYFKFSTSYKRVICFPS